MSLQVTESKMQKVLHSRIIINIMSETDRLNSQIQKLEKKLDDLIEILGRDGLNNLGLNMRARGHQFFCLISNQPSSNQNLLNHFKNKLSIKQGMENCPTCGTPLEKDFINANSKNKVSLVTHSRCPKCKKYVDSSQHNVPK